jgi:predicted glycogen debranching enzyme
MLETEWLETNGVGGWASLSVSGILTRSYHGLLVDGSQFPHTRTVLLSKLDETLLLNGIRYELGSNQFPDTIAPEGFLHLESFKKELFPEFIFRAGGWTIKKEVLMPHGHQATLIRYTILEAKDAEGSFEFSPLIAGRDYHTVKRANEAFQTAPQWQQHTLSVCPYHDVPQLNITVPQATYDHHPQWFLNIEYLEEYKRGLPHQEDLMQLGHFTRTIRQGDTFIICAHAGTSVLPAPEELWHAEVIRREALIQSAACTDAFHRALTLAADQCIVKRADGKLSIIAGYPWFTDWGRDSMIALPGLCLSTKRFAEAKEILMTYASFLHDGMIPNRFGDADGAPEYGSVDATLWWIMACYQYIEQTKDMQTGALLLEKILQAVDAYTKGTHYQIQAHEQTGLLTSGTAQTQLTWMDARVQGIPVTPRHGYAVEINALWINALAAVAHLLDATGAAAQAATFHQRAAQASASFQNTFWNDAAGYLYDVVHKDGKDSSLRPNQLIALSLPFPILTTQQSKRILSAIEQKLLTPRGLRSLSADSPNYKPTYRGGPDSRDAAYHQGTVWSWLIGTYITALLKTYGQKGLPKASQLLKEFEVHLLQEGCIGSISEIFDASYPHQPRGCFAQAWSIGETLRSKLFIDETMQSSGLLSKLLHKALRTMPWVSAEKPPLIFH